MIKVFHIITKLELGGAQQNTVYTVRNLDKKKFDVRLITGTGGILDKEVNDLNPVFLKELKREISPVNDFIALIKLYRILRREKPDIIHTHSSKAGIIGRIAGYIAGVKIIIHTYHGFGFNDYQNFFVRWFYIFLEKIAAYFTSFFIFVSKENLNTARKYFIVKTDNYRIIRSGIKLSEFKKEKDYRFVSSFIEKTPDTKIVSTVANLKPQKNPDDFLMVAEYVINRTENVYFIYAGGGDKLDYYREKVKELKLERRCFFTGWFKSVPEIFSSTDIFILTSLWEGLPRALVEAMASNTIPVCYKTDGVRDIIKNGENGFVVEQKDYKSMAEIIIRLINNSELFTKIKENLKKTDLSEFDIDYMVRQQEILYEELFYGK